MNTIHQPAANPYVGPRTFSQEQRHLFFGREREARDLLARVLSERLVLFYAQSGAGKSSLINARLVPGLREIGYAVLPVSRVGGDLAAGAAEVDNIYLFNLMLSLAQSEATPDRFAHLNLSTFLIGLSTEDGEHYTFDEANVPAPAITVDETTPARPYVLIIDQFEELITSHPGRWRERTEFFRQLNQAMQDDPNLWVVLALREDYVAPIEPYAPLLADRMRARFYMERMGVDAALDAIRRPAGLGGRPFAAGAAEQLAEDLRQVRVPGQEATIPGQYVEPVQLQVVCLQLWENIKARPPGPITAADLQEAGDVDRALIQFYEETLAATLADPTAQVTERQLRTWFDRELITPAGTRGLVRQGEEATGSLLNAVVGRLQRRFLVRAEARGGDAWIELVHDRFVEPIRASNAAWFPEHLSALQRQAALWDEQGRSSGLLLRDAALAEAEAWAADHASEVQPDEQEFLAACRQAQDAVDRERRQSRRILILGVVAGVVAVLAIALAIWGLSSSAEATYQRGIADENAKKAGVAQVTAEASAAEAKRQEAIAKENAQKAKDAQVAAEASAKDAGIQKQKAEANAKLARDQLDRQEGLARLQEAYKLKEQRDVQGAIEKFRASQAIAERTGIDLGINVDAEIQDVRRQEATRLVQEGEALAKGGDFPAAEAKFKTALALEPPPDTPVYVYVPAGPFFMGEDASSTFTDTLPAYWIQRTEVTNAQYRRCVKAREAGEADGCMPTYDGNIRYQTPQFAKQPVVGVTWSQAQAYATWVGGRLPTEAEWEKACRGTDGRTYPWGNPDPTSDLLNYAETGLGTWSVVGSYPSGASPYGALDMTGNVWEWTSSAYANYPYDPKDGREDPESGELRVVRGGSFNYYRAYLVLCAVRREQLGRAPDYRGNDLGFGWWCPPAFDLWRSGLWSLVGFADPPDRKRIGL